MSTPDLPPSPVPAAAAPAKKSNTLVIVLCVIFGVFLLILASCVGTCIYVGKKAQTYAKESEKNPQISALALAAAIYPGVEVVSKDLDAGTLVLKNQKTGEIVKLDAKDFSQEKIAVLLDKIAHSKDVSSILDRNAKTEVPKSELSEPSSGTVQAGGSTAISGAQFAAQETTLKTFPADFPIYSSGGVKTTEAVKNGFSGVTTSLHVFETSDSPAKVADFYTKKLTSDGYTQVISENGSDENGAKLSRIFQKGETGTTFNVEVRIEDGKTHAQVNQILLKQP